MRIFQKKTWKKDTNCLVVAKRFDLVTSWGITVVQSAVMHIGILFVGTKSLKTAVRGIARYVEPAGIGGNGIVNNVIDVHMA